MLDDIRAFARRRPAMFLGLCALAGVVVGRLGRGAVAANTSLDSKDGSSSYGYNAASYSSTPGRYATTTPDTGYGTGYDTGYSGAGSYSGETAATGPSIGYAAGSMPDSGGTYAGDEDLQPPYGGQGDLNR